MIEMDLVRSDPKLKLTPTLMEEIERRDLTLFDYIDLLLKDLVREADPFKCALSLVNEGKVALARRYLSEYQLGDLEVMQFEEACRKIRQDTSELAANVDNQIAEIKDVLEANKLDECLSLQSTWRKAIQQERYRIAQCDLLTAQNLLVEHKNLKRKQPMDELPDHEGEALQKPTPEGELPPEGRGNVLSDPGSRPKTPSTTEDDSSNISQMLLLLNQAISTWRIMTVDFSNTLRDSLRPTEQLARPPVYIDVYRLFKKIEGSQNEGYQEAENALKLFFYLHKKDQKQLQVRFYQTLAVYISEQLKYLISLQDFESASRIFDDIVKLFKDNTQLRSGNYQDIFVLYRNGVEVRTAPHARDLKIEFSKFKELLTTQILDLPGYLTETSKEQLSKAGKVLFFYHRIQALRTTQDFATLTSFFTEYSSSIANLVEGNLELSRLYDVTKNDYDEALYRKAEQDLTELELPSNLPLEDTLAFVKDLPPYQIVPALTSLTKKFSELSTSPEQSLLQMYKLVLLLFDIQQPEEFIFSADTTSRLINGLRTMAAKEQPYIQLIPKTEVLPLTILDTLEKFIEQAINMVSVTDLSVVRTNIARALESLRRQRNFLQDTGPATRHLWHMLGDHWISILVARQQALSRHTSLELTLQSDEILADEVSSLVIYVKNTGPGTAQDIRVTLTSSDLSIQEQVIVFIPILKSGDETQASFTVKPRGNNRVCDVRVLVKYLDTNKNPIIFSEDRTLTTKTTGQKAFPRNSPYVWGQPLDKNSAVFFGREDVFEFLRTRFWGEERNKIIALQGERRMGKTSILYQIEKRKLFGSYRVVFFDFQGRYANTSSIQEFFYGFARRVRSEARLPNELQIEKSQFFVADREYYEIFDAWLDRVEEELERRDTQIVILVDEFEKLLGRRFDSGEKNAQLIEELLQHLRSMMLTRKRLNWIITGSWSLVTKQREYFSSLFGMALSHWIGYLERNDAMALIQTPVQDFLSYDQAAIERILQLTGGHPYHIQIMCDELFNRAREFSNRQITVSDVDRVIEYTLKQVTETNFRMVWASLRNPISRKVLASIAEAMRDPFTPVYTGEVFRFLRRRSPSLSEDSFFAVLDIDDGELVRRELIQLHEVEPDRVRIRSELLYSWLRKAKPLTTVLREER
ncbi:MAG: AAA-like domain-containing protein [Anaerolineae bacterium]|nr:AAA-like domain-containing protein [Anaerolineae bacterium]